MVKHIVIVSDRGQDNIAIYREEPAFVVMADRTDINHLRHLQQAQLAGIYLLISDDKRYVGQATNLYQRLSVHKREKDWWTQVIFFGREDGRLDKSQLDYLENQLISDFQDTGFLLENATKGNTSWIDPIKEVQAKQIWDITQGILEDIVNLNIYELPKKSDILLTEQKEVTDKHYLIHLENGITISGKHATQCYVAFFQHLLDIPETADSVRDLVLNGEPSSRFLLGTEERFDKTGMRLTTPLATGVHLYNNLSTADKKRVLQRFADQIGLKITIDWD